MKALARLLSAGFAATALAVALPAFADVEKGIDAWLRGDYAEAVNQWRPLAIEGDADAQFNMGQAYKLGRGVPTDFVQAEHWYQRAALQGHAEAEDNYGLALFQNGRRAEAVPWLEKSVARGEPRAEYVLGTALFNGDLVVKDRVRAYALVAHASAAGLPQASKTLAQMDQYMPLDQRQQALALARQLDANRAKPRVPEAKPSQTAAVAQSKTATPPGAPYPKPGEPAKTAPADKPVTAPPVKTARIDPPKPAPPTAKPVPTGADWRVQLGAFSDAARAKTLWGSLKPKVKGLTNAQPYYVKAGALTRLQAGPFGGKAEAERQCTAIKATGQPCLAVKP